MLICRIGLIKSWMGVEQFPSRSESWITERNGDQYCATFETYTEIVLTSTGLQSGLYFRPKGVIRCPRWAKVSIHPRGQALFALKSSSTKGHGIEGFYFTIAIWFNTLATTSFGRGE